MKNEKYIFNNQTLQYEKVKRSTQSKLLITFGYLSAVLVSAILIYAVGYRFFPSPKEKALQRELQQMQYHFTSLSDEFEDLTKNVDDLQTKDAEVHRMIFGVQPIDESVWNGGVGGHEKYPFLTRFKTTGELLTAALEKSEKLKRKITIQGHSLDTLFKMATEREDKIASIPSIKPVREDKLKRKMRHLSGYGIRIHPVHKVKKFHRGIDFTAPRGTPIQATGNGVVSKVERKKRGYGRSILIDHGYGYQSLYAHMDKVEVKVGQEVTKGQRLGTVGSTGTSTAPHLHYEVRLNGRSVNPIDYCMDGLSPEEYKELVIKAQEMNQSFD